MSRFAYLGVLVLIRASTVAAALWAFPTVLRSQIRLQRTGGARKRYLPPIRSPAVYSPVAIVLSMLLIILIPATWAFPPERHPVLLYETEDLPRIKERITRAPYDAWWAWIQDQADEALTLDFSTVEGDRFKTRYAKALTFAYVVTDSLPYADRAKVALLTVRFPPDGGQWGELHFEAEGAANYAEAYDMLAENLSDDPAAHAQIRDTIYREGHRLFTTSPIWYALQKNNWAIRQYSALGLMAMALASYEGGASTSEQWANKAQEEVLNTLSAQIDEEGGYAEGPYYHRYAAELYLPYMLALRRFTGEDLLVRPEIRALHDWSVKIRLPNGLRPNVDDAHLSGFFGHYLTDAYADGPVHRWDWENASEPFAPEYTKIDAISLFDDQGTAEAPPWSPTLFMPEAGQAVFRSDWSSEATYFLLLGEHGKAAQNGWGHEHPDVLSFILYAGEEMLATDGGYIRWEDRTLVNSAKNHNLILVDGGGPSGGALGVNAEAYIENTFSTDFLDHAEAWTSYQGVTFRRHVFFSNKRYVILMDDIDSHSGSHRYDWLLHGGGLPFEYRGIGGRWTVGDMELLAGLNGSNALSLDTEVGIHSFDYLQKLEHTTLKVTQTAEDTRYLAVLFPKKADEQDPVIGPFREEGLWGMAVIQRDTVDIVLLRDDQEALLSSNALKEVHVKPVQSDGHMAWFHFESNSLRAWYIQEGRMLTIEGDSALSASQPLSMALHTRGSTWEGYIRSAEGASLRLSTPVKPDSVIFGGRAVDILYQHGQTTFRVEGEGRVRIYLGEPVALGSVTIRVQRATGGSKITAGQIGIRAGDPADFAATVTDTAGNPLDEPVTWSVEGEAGTVDENGHFIASTQAGDTGMLIATAEDISDTVGVTILPNLLKRIEILPASVELHPGERVTFKAQGYDAHGNKINVRPFWHVTRDIGTISSITGTLVAGDTPGSGDVVAFAQAVFGEASMDVAGSAKVVVRAVPEAFVLYPNVPNPFNPRTLIPFALPRASAARLTVYDLRGHLVRVLVDGWQEPGHHQVVWDGRDKRGQEVSSGVYMIRLEAGEQPGRVTFSQTRRVTLLR